MSEEKEKIERRIKREAFQEAARESYAGTSNWGVSTKGSAGTHKDRLAVRPLSKSELTETTEQTHRYLEKLKFPLKCPYCEGVWTRANIFDYTVKCKGCGYSTDVRRPIWMKKARWIRSCRVADLLQKGCENAIDGKRCGRPIGILPKRLPRKGLGLCKRCWKERRRVQNVMRRRRHYLKHGR